VSAAHGALLAGFDGAEPLLRAIRALRAQGYRRLDAYTPFPVPGLAEALALTPTRLARVVLLCALAGGAGGYLLQWWSAVVDYPVNAGGRPLHAWPAFVPVSFELAVLAGALGAFAGLLIGCGLPRLHHPVFAAREFTLATRDRFFVLVHPDDPCYARAGSEETLRALGALTVTELPP
jgi:hypothetical protein